LIAGRIDPRSRVATPELEQQRGQVVGDHAVLDAVLQQRVPHEHVEHEARRRALDAAGGENGVERTGVVEQGVEAFLAQTVLRPFPGLAVTGSEEPEDERRFGAAERSANVRQDHGSLLRVASVRDPDARSAACSAAASRLTSLEHRVSKAPAALHPPCPLGGYRKYISGRGLTGLPTRNRPWGVQGFG